MKQFETQAKEKEKLFVPEDKEAQVEAAIKEAREKTAAKDIWGKEARSADFRKEFNKSLEARGLNNDEIMAAGRQMSSGRFGSKIAEATRHTEISDKDSNGFDGRIQTAKSQGQGGEHGAGPGGRWRHHRHRRA